jgi:hypothetical protein
MLKIYHNAGFFSCLTIRLENILNYFNINKKTPDYVDSSEQFKNYKITNVDITNEYFKDNDILINYTENILHSTDDDKEIQFSDYKLLNFKKIKPFVDKYFALSEQVINNVKYLEDKYSLDYKNLLVIFYRGLDKYTETNLPNYNDYLNKVRTVINDKTTILVQSDESEFILFIKNEFKNVIVINEVNNTTSNNKHTTVEFTLPVHLRLKHSVDFLSVVKIMSKAKTIICNSGNISLWILLYRENAENLYQYLSPKEYIYGIRNHHYDNNKINFWLN